MLVGSDSEGRSEHATGDAIERFFPIIRERFVELRERLRWIEALGVGFA